MLVEADTFTAALSGERGAFGQVLVACDPELRRHLSGRIDPAYQGAVSIGDVLQVTYVEAFLRVGSLEERTMEGLVRWLKAIADNNLKDAIRSLNAVRRPPRKKQVVPTREESAATFLAQFVGSDTSPSSGALRSEFAELLERALIQLPPDYEKAVRLYDLEERNIEEVSSSLSRSAGAAHMIRARAFDRLRELLGDTSRFFTGTA